MNGEGTIEDLTEEQRARLTTLLDKLSTFPVPETIVRCLEAVGIDSKIEGDLERADAAMAAAWAYDRAHQYLVRLRSLNQERMQIGNEIRRLMQHPDPATEAEVVEAAQSRVLAPDLAGRQEVVINFFCVSVQHIHSLLIVVAAAVAYEIPPDDLSYLDEFRFLRNHFEHWYDRLPGKTNEAGLVTKALTADEYHVTGGLQTDEKNRFIVIEPKKSGPVTHVVDVTNDGMARIEQIVQETSAKVKEFAIEQVRAHFIADPQDVPSPEDVRDDLLFTVGGYQLQSNLG
jgi:hypothetical protein